MILRLNMILAIFFFLSGNIFCEPEDLELFKKQNKIALEADLDNDGISELIPINSSVNKPPIIFVKVANGDYKETVADQGAQIKLKNDIGISNVFAFKNGIVVYIKPATIFLPGSNYMAGSHIILYKFSDGKYLFLKQYYSEYKLIDNSIKYEILHEEKPDLGRYPFTNIIMNNEKTELLMQSYDRVIILDSSGYIFKVESAPAENIIIKQFKIKQDGNIKIFFKRSITNEFSLWNSKDKKTTNFIDLGKGSIVNAIIDEGDENTISVIQRRGINMFNIKLSINDNNIKIINEVEIKQE